VNPQRLRPRREQFSQRDKLLIDARVTFLDVLAIKSLSISVYVEQWHFTGGEQKLLVSECPAVPPRSALLQLLYGLSGETLECTLVHAGVAIAVIEHHQDVSLSNDQYIDDNRGTDSGAVRG
jgi:hypothetical protein